MLEIVERAVHRMDRRSNRRCRSRRPQRRRVKRQQPDRGDAEVLEVVQLLGQPAKVADAVAVAVAEGADVHFVNDRVLVPEGVVVERGDLRQTRSRAHGCASELIAHPLIVAMGNDPSAVTSSPSFVRTSSTADRYLFRPNRRSLNACASTLLRRVSSSPISAMGMPQDERSCPHSSSRSDRP